MDKVECWPEVFGIEKRQKPTLTAHRSPPTPSLRRSRVAPNLVHTQQLAIDWVEPVNEAICHILALTTRTRAGTIKHWTSATIRFDGLRSDCNERMWLHCIYEVYMNWLEIIRTSNYGHHTLRRRDKNVQSTITRSS